MSATTQAPPLRIVPGSRTERRAPLRGAAVTLAVAAATVGLALDGGGSPITTRSVAAIVVWWALLLAVVFAVWPVNGLPRPALACGALLAAFTAFTGLSAVWAPSAEAAFLEFDRLALHLALFTVAVVATRPGDGRRWADGLALAIAVIGLLALAQRLLPGVMPDSDIPRLLPAAGTRLSYPVGYWNGLAILLGLGIPLLLRTATAAGGALPRGAAVAALPALAGAMYLTSSRGGFGVVVLAVAIFLVLTARRFAALQALLVAVAGSLVAIAILRAHPALVDEPLSAAARDEGTGVAALIVLVCLACGAVSAALGAIAPPQLRVPRAVAAAVVVAVVAGALALAAADPAERFRSFKAPPAEQAQEGNFTQDHLFSDAGSGRWQFWGTALDQFGERPVAGDGAGSYAAYWAEHGELSWFIRNAHSLWLETLAEVGLIGLLLLAGAFALALVTGLGRLRGASEEDRTVLAALLAVVAGFAIGASIDWIWQVPVIAAVGVVGLGLLTGAATAPRDAPSRAPGARFKIRAAVLVAAWLAIAAQGIPLLVSTELEASQEAAGRGDFTEALDRAASARSIQPWAASPHLQLALVREEQGELAAARTHVGTAIERAPRDWRLRLVAARLATKAGDIPAATTQLREARRLSPRSYALRGAPLTAKLPALRSVCALNLHAPAADTTLRRCRIGFGASPLSGRRRET